MERQDLLNSIKAGMTAAEIAVKFHLHDLDLYQEINKLENAGYTLSRNYYSDGNFKYTFAGRDLSNLHETNIITKPDEKEVRILCMSDLHYTSKYQNLDVVHKAFEYAKNNGINLIFNGGDILHGNFGFSETEFEDGIEQIEKFLKDYPFDNRILTFGVGGDHDSSIYYKEMINPIDVIRKERHDIVIPNYFANIIKIKDANIVLRHLVTKNKTISQNFGIEIPSCGEIFINGHPHRYDFYDNGSNISINLPTTSDLTSTLNGFVVMNLIYNSGHLSRVESDYITYINGKEVTLVHNAGNISYKGRTIDNVEEYCHQVVNNPYKQIDRNLEETTIKGLNEELEKTQNDLSEAKLENEKLDSTNNSLMVSLEEANKEKERLCKTISNYKKEKASKETKIENLENENKRVLESNKQINKNNKNLKEENKRVRDKNEELLNELNKYKKLLEEYQKSNVQVVETKEEETIEIVEALLQEETIEVAEETPEVMSLEEKNKLEFYLKEFKKARIQEFKEYLKNHPEVLNSKKEEEQNESKLKVAVVSSGNRIHEIVKTMVMNELELEDSSRIDFHEKMESVMDAATFELMGEKEKKRVKKLNKALDKGQKIYTSQLTKAERLDLLKNKYSKK